MEHRSILYPSAGQEKESSWSGVEEMAHILTCFDGKRSLTHFILTIHLLAYSSNMVSLLCWIVDHLHRSMCVELIFEPVLLNLLYNFSNLGDDLTTEIEVVWSDAPLQNCFLPKYIVSGASLEYWKSANKLWVLLSDLIDVAVDGLVDLCSCSNTILYFLRLAAMPHSSNNGYFEDTNWTHHWTLFHPQLAS